MITVYSAGATDFSGNGLGPIAPESCTVTETLNGNYEVTIKHPYDEAGKYLRLIEGNIVRVPVPAGKTPYMRISKEAEEGTDIYRVETDGRPLRLRSGPGTEYRCLGAYDPGTEITVADRASHAEWSEVVTPDGKHGWMFSGNLEYVRSASTGTQAEESIKKPMQLRDQPFRIYKIVPTLNEVTAYARHIFYDLADNMVTEYKPSATTTGAAAFRGLAEAAESEHEFNFYSDLTTKAEGVEIIDKNPAEAILDADGLIDYYGGELARDWWDVYLAKRVGEETQIQIREGKNLTGISYSVDLTNVATRIIPRGSDKDGKPLYLPEKYIDSEQHIDDYPTVKWCMLEVKDAKEKTSGDDKRSKEECYALMREAAAKAFEEGCDLPDVTLNVDFIDCADTDEYSQYKLLDSISIGDTVRVIAKRVGVSVAMRMTQYTYNCLTKQYEKMTLGTLDATIEGNMINPRSIGSGSIKGGMIKLGGIGSGQIADGAVNSLKIGLAAIDYAHIAEATINKLNANSITAVRAEIRKLVAGEITADQLYVDLATIAAAQITAANIDKANIKWAEIESLLAEIAEIAHAEIANAEIDWAQIVNAKITAADIGDAEIGTAQIALGAITQALIENGAVGTAQIADGSITEAKIVSLNADVIKSGTISVERLLLKGADGLFYAINATAGGLTSTQLTQKQYKNAISGTALVARSVTADKIAAKSITANEILSQTITAAEIDVTNLFSAKATITALDNYILRTSTIQAIEGKLDVWASDKISLAIKDVQVGGTQLIRRSQSLPTDTGLAAADRWRLDASVSTYRYNDRFTALKFYETGATEDAYKNAYSPVGLLPAGWQGQKVTLSAYVYSPNWSAVDSSLRCSVRLNQGGTSVMNYGARTLIAAGGVISSQANETGTVKNKKWTRVSATFDLTAEELSSGTGVLEDNTHVYVGFSLWKNGDVRLYAPKLEMGNKATDWSPAPDDPVDGVQAGTTVTINKDQFKVKTPEFIVKIPTEDGSDTMMRIDEDGAFFKRLEAPNVARKYAGPENLTVSSAATSAQLKAGTHYRSISDVAEALSERWIDKTINVAVAAGHTEYGAANFRGMVGSYWVQITGDASKPAKVIGAIECSFNSTPMLFRNIDVEIDPNVSTNGYHAEGSSTTVTIRNCVITGQGVSGAGSTRAIIASRNACVYAYENELYHCQRSYYAQIAGTIAAYASKGNCTVGANRATMYLTGTMPCADPNTWTVSTSAGQVLTGSISVDQGSNPSASIPTHTTVSYSSTNADTYAGGGWNNYSNSDIYQGYTTGLGEHRGCFWFDNASIRSALKNKTIKQATLTLYQVSGVGRNQPVQVSLEGITVNYGSSDVPYGKAECEYGVIGTTLGVNQATTFTLPTKVVTDLAAGTINGLMLRTGETSVMKNDDNSYNYARFAGGASNANRPVLTVVYQT